MRWYSLSLSLSLSFSISLAPTIALGLVACGQGKPQETGSAGSAGSAAVTEARPVAKKPVDTKPLPPLAKDPGGATGKPLRSVGFGGLGVDAARAIAVAPTGDAYVVGYFDREGDFGPAGKIKAAGDQTVKKDPPSDGYIVKVGADGKLAWARTFGGDHGEVANSVAVRGDRIAVVGTFADEIKLGEIAKQAKGSDDVFVAALDPSGAARWIWQAGGKDSDGAHSVAAMPDGGWVVGGSYTSTATFGTVELKSKGGTDAFLLKLDAAGNLEWVKSFGGRYPDRIKHVGVDGQGNIYVQGEFRDAADWGGEKLTAAGGADFDIVLAKYDLNGDHKWSKRFGSQFDEHAGGLAVDPAGNVTITGAFRKQISFGDGDDHVSLGEDDIYVARFDTTGKLAWARTYGSERDDSGGGVAADAAGNTVLTGWFQSLVDFGKGPVRSKNNNKDVFALKLDPQGALTWVQTWGDKDHDQGRGIAIDDKGASYVVGLYRFQLSAAEPPLESARATDDRAPEPDTFVVKLDR